jgi:hypothetical protein
VSKESAPIVLSPVDPGTSNQTSLANCPSRQAAGYPYCNDDYRITNGIATAQHPSTPTIPYDQASGNITYNATTRVLSLSGTASLTLGGGLYNFCEIDASGQSTISLAATVQAEIFIDSPDDPGSGCSNGTGNFSMTGGASFINPTGNPLSLQLYAYGLKNGKATLSYSGNAAFVGTIYAPQSIVSLSGNGTVTGAIAGRQVTLNGNAFNWDSRDATLQATATGVYYRTAWAQCTSAYSNTTPLAGCG